MMEHKTGLNIKETTLIDQLWRDRGEEESEKRGRRELEGREEREGGELEESERRNQIPIFSENWLPCQQ